MLTQSPAATPCSTPAPPSRSPCITAPMSAPDERRGEPAARRGARNSCLSSGRGRWVWRPRCSARASPCSIRPSSASRSPPSAATSTAASAPCSGWSPGTRSPWPPSCSSAAPSATATGASGSSPSGSPGSPSPPPSAASRRRRGSSSPPGWSRGSAARCWRRAAWPSCRPRSAPTTGPVPSAPGRGLSGVAAAAGPLVGRLSPRRRLVALGLLHQPARVRGRARHHGPPRARVAGSRRATGRVDTVGAALAVVFLAGLTYGLDRSADARVVEPGRGGLPRGGRRVGARLPARRAPPGPPHAPARAVPLPPVQRRQRRHLRRLRRPRRCPLPAPGRAADRQGLLARSSPGIALLPADAGHAGPLGPVGRAVGPHRSPPADDGRARSSSAPGSPSSSRATDPGSYWTQVFPAVLVFAIGLAVTVAPLTATAMGAAPAEHSGVASAVNNVVARAAGLLAVAVLPLLAGLTGAAALQQRHAGQRLPHRHGDLGRRLRRRRGPGGADHPQPGPHAGRRRRSRSRAGGAHLELRRQRPAARSRRWPPPRSGGA